MLSHFDQRWRELKETGDYQEAQVFLKRIIGKLSKFEAAASESDKEDVSDEVRTVKSTLERLATDLPQPKEGLWTQVATFQTRLNDIAKLSFYIPVVG